MRKIGVIAEIKKASPSKGVLRKDFNPVEIAKSYMQCGADAISVLTDIQFFQGNISYLKDIAAIKTVPLLRKDFIIDEFQILEAKANGADAVLLIAEILSREQIKDFTSIAFENDLEVLLEIHSEKQLNKINFDINKIIGINNRDLDTYNVDISTTKELARKIPSHCTIVSESGIGSKIDLDYLKNAGVHAVLAGEHFMKSQNIEESVTQFMEWCKIEG
jgi:indole-3-glycerol phosphate synthase